MSLILFAPAIAIGRAGCVSVPYDLRLHPPLVYLSSRCSKYAVGLWAAVILVVKLMRTAVEDLPVVLP